MPSIAPGACGSRLTLSEELTVYTVMNNFRDQRPEVTIPYTFEPGFTQELQIAWPIQIRIPDTGTTAATTSSASTGGKEGVELSTGAIIGLAFGGFFSIFIVCLAAYLLLRRRRNRRGEDASQPEMREGRPETPYSPAPPYSPQSMYLQRKPLPQQYANVVSDPPCLGDCGRLTGWNRRVRRMRCLGHRMRWLSYRRGSRRRKSGIGHVNWARRRGLSGWLERKET